MDDWPLTIGSTGQRVKDAQWLLQGHNVFATVFYYGALDGLFYTQTAAATRAAKFALGYPTTQIDGLFGPILRAYLLGEKGLPLAYVARRLARKRQRKFSYPAIITGKLIGFPGVGTHSWIDPPNNWESDNAVDIALPYGTALLAVADGLIGPQFGPLPSTEPRFHGIRLHLVTADNEFYYAHLSSTAQGIGPGVHVTQNQVLGKSGDANGVDHLHIACRIGSPFTTFLQS